MLAAGGDAEARPRAHVGRLLEEGGLPEGVVADLEGRLADDPRRRLPPEEGCWLEVDLVSIRARGVRRQASGRVRTAVPAAPDGIPDPCDAGTGTLLLVPAVISRPRSFANPGALDYAAFLASRGIAATARARSARLVRILEPPPAASRALTRARRFIVGSIERAFGVERSRAAVAKALVLGLRDDLTPEVEKVLQAAGTAHLLAVSGFNVAVLAACVWWIGRILRAGAACRSASLAAALVAYLALTGREPSVTRAVLGGLLHLCGRSLGRRPRALSTVAAVCLAVAALRPAAVRDASFQLTFLAAAALAAHAGPLARRLPGPRAAASALAVSAVALAATTPLSARLFNRAAPGALAANLAASPLMAFAFVGALALPPASALTSLLGAAGVAFRAGLAPEEAAAWTVARAIDAAVAASAAVAVAPGLSYACVTPRTWTVAAFLVAAALASGVAIPGRLRSASALAAIVLGAACAWPGERSASGALLRHEAPPPPSGLRLTVFDVGQGSAALVETSAGGRLLVDAGGLPRTTFDVGERVVGRALLTLGIKRLDAVALTHLDVDHAGGIPGVLRLFGGREMWVAASDHAAGGLRRLESLALDRGRVVRLLSRGDAFHFFGARVEVLNPPRGPLDLADNDRSLVLRISAAGRAILLAGDVEARAETYIVPLLRRCDLILVPHHGSRTSSTLPLLRAAAPLWGIVSCGRANRFGHPHAEAEARLRLAGVRPLRTDLHGAIRAEIAAPPPGASRGAIRVDRFGPYGWTPAAPDGGPSGDRADRVGDERDDEDGGGRRSDREPAW